MIDGIDASLAGAQTALGTARPKEDPAHIRNAAQQFESLLLGQILKTARESSSGGWSGSGEDSASETAMDIAEQQFAQVLASGGGLGLANLIVKGLDRKA
jgi:peptidoglycan hydrolase FlgJ